MNGYVYNDEIYLNALMSPDDIAGWRMEGDGAADFASGRMRLSGTRDPGEGQAANIVFWCPQDVPDHVSIKWEFTPIQEPGLCIMFFAAKGRNGEDLFDPTLAPRSGPYQQYHSGDINALHISYFRRKFDTERAFCTCNLRKSKGFHMVAQGADPLPAVVDAKGPYVIEIIKDGPQVLFGAGEKDGDMLQLLSWTDDGTTYGPQLTGGKIGFRQMTPMIGEYANLSISRIEKENV